MSLPYNWKTATVDDVIDYYAGTEGVSLDTLTDKLEDANAPVPVRIERSLDYNGSWIERKLYPLEALKVLVWNEELVPASDLENWLDLPRAEIEGLRRYAFCRPVGINRKGEWLFDAEYMLKCRKAWLAEKAGEDFWKTGVKHASPREAEFNWFSLDFRARQP